MMEAKPTWDSLPVGVRKAVEHMLGRTVVGASTVWGGYTPSATFRLILKGGTTVFFKGVSAAGNQFMRSALRREERVYREVAAIKPWAPELLAVVTIEDWHVLLLEDISDAQHVPPWTTNYARKAAESLAAFHNNGSRFTLPKWLPPAVKILLGTHFGELSGWRNIIDDQDAKIRLVDLAGPARYDAKVWFERCISYLVEKEASILTMTGPSTLLHTDVRSDNLLFRKDGSVVMVDWPGASLGCGILDAAFFFPSVDAEGGPKPEDMVSWYVAALDSHVNDGDVIGAAVAVSGYFAARAGLPDIPGLPRVRAVQRIQLASALSWVARLTDLPTPTWVSSV